MNYITQLILSLFLSLFIGTPGILNAGASSAFAENDQKCTFLSQPITIKDYPEVGKHYFPLILAWIRSHQPEYLILENCGLTNDHAQKLLPVLKANKSIKVFSVEQNKISPELKKELYDALTPFSINISNECIEKQMPPLGDSGLKDLTAYFYQFPKLRSLTLANQNITDAGVQTLVENLHHLEHLEILILSNNSITDEGAKKLQEAVKTLKKFKTVDLNGNRITAPAPKEVPHHSPLAPREITPMSTGFGTVRGTKRSITDEMNDEAARRMRDLLAANAGGGTVRMKPLATAERLVGSSEKLTLEFPAKSK